MLLLNLIALILLPALILPLFPKPTQMEPSSSTNQTSVVYPFLLILHLFLVNKYWILVLVIMSIFFFIISHKLLLDGWVYYSYQQFDSPQCLLHTHISLEFGVFQFLIAKSHLLNFFLANSFFIHENRSLRRIRKGELHDGLYVFHLAMKPSNLIFDFSTSYYFCYKQYSS